MFRLDAKFLDDLGLSALPEEAKNDFLQHIYTELETRVGERLTQDMSDEMLDEFGHFVEHDEADEDKWFNENLPDYTAREDFHQFKEANPGLSEADTKSQFGAMKWLQLNRPNYPQIVSSVLEELKNEIRDNREAILTGINGDNSAAVTPAA